MSIWPNDWKAKIIPTTEAKNSVGESMGRVTCQNCAQRPAPSIRALSYSSSGIVWSPASTMTVNRPMFIQTVAIETEMSAQFGSVNQAPICASTPWCSLTAQPPSFSHATRDSPTPSKTSFSTPIDGWSSTYQRTAVIATDAASVEEKIVRKMTMPGSFRFASTARKVPIAIAGTTVYSVNVAVTSRLPANEDDVSTSRYWS